MRCTSPRAARLCHTWEVAEEGLLSCVASHMRLQSIPTSMVGTLPAAANPLAGVFLLPTFYVFVVDMLDQSIHCPQIPGVAALPYAQRHLRLEILVFETRICG